MPPQSPPPTLMESGEYFNNVFFDDAVLSIVNILTVMDQLYQLGKQRDDEVGDRKMYSKLTGLHTMPFDTGAKDRFVKDFNSSVDKIKSSLANSGVDAGKLSKANTRPLQFLPTAQLWESTLQYLLKDHASDALDKMTPKELIENLALIRAAKTTLSMFN